MSSATIDRLIINPLYAEPAHHWQYDRETRLFSLAEGRRPYAAPTGSATIRCRMTPPPPGFSG